MDMYAQAQAATTQAGTVRQTLAVKGGHLFLSPNGVVLHFAPVHPTAAAALASTKLLTPKQAKDAVAQADRSSAVLAADTRP